MKTTEQLRPPLPTPEEIATLPPDGGERFNRLIFESSPYLLQHAANPVDWYPWGAEAFQKARQEDKPIFLSIGYSTCHWCHVMEVESFESEEVAAIINEHFIPIKVDREERPDLDQLYMTAVQLLTGGGGWPMSVFLTPEGDPFFGGTYFPPDNRRGRPGMVTLLPMIAEHYHNQTEEVERTVRELKAAMRQVTAFTLQRPVVLKPEFVRKHLENLREVFDPFNGGFAGAPKFPPHATLRLILDRHSKSPDPALLERALLTLDHMAAGGIHDHIGGGFHRYAVDSVWLVPHFEKMLYDNAQLSRSYTDGWRITGNGDYRRTAEGIFDWMLREMTDPQGGFYAALDADSEGVEGKFYLWTKKEIMDVLGEPAGRIFCEAFSITDSGNYLDEASEQKTGQNIPHIRQPLDSVARRLKLDPAVLRETLAEARTKLLDYRNRRVHPGCDDKVLTSWNGLALGSLAYAGKHFNNKTYLDAADRCAQFILNTMVDGRLLRTWRKGKPRLNGCLDDYAYLADGLIDLYEAGGNRRYLDEARQFAETVLEHFVDADGSLFMTSDDHEKLILRQKDFFDQAVPSGSGVMARVLVRLAEVTGEERYRSSAFKALTAFAPVMSHAGHAADSLFLAAAMYFNGRTEADQLREGKVLAEAATTGVAVRVYGPESAVHAGEAVRFEVALDIAEGFHVNAHEPGVEGMSAAEVSVGHGKHIEVGTLSYPPGIPLYTDGMETPLNIYRGFTVIEVTLAIASQASRGRYMVPLTLSMQPCNEGACLEPVKINIKVPLEIA